MVYYIQNIATIIHADASIHNDASIEYLLIDSRKIVFPKTSLFFAISGPRRDGHQFIKEVYERGVRNFVIKNGFDSKSFPEANFLAVEDVLMALQNLTCYHRKQFSIPVIGITGSNGKTIVKEWLYQLLQKDFNIVRSPRSYNSQIGVPLSVWQMNQEHRLGIFEAGISTTGEMKQLAKIIQPTLGVFTNIADAHSEGFTNDREKAIEKSKLFVNVETLVFGREALQHSLSPDGADEKIFPNTKVFFSWSTDSEATLKIIAVEKGAKQTILSGIYREKKTSITIPFTDKISIDNAITCWCILLQLSYSEIIIQERMLQLEPVEMRMQLKKAINNCYLLNDSYSNDLASLDLAIDYLQQQAGNQKTTLVLSDILQSGQYEEALYSDIAAQLSVRGIHRLIGIGPAIVKYQFVFDGIDTLQTSFYHSTEDFLQQVSTQTFSNEYILLKGATNICL